ncbi:hypothetical protein [Streptomyces sp. NBC_01483]|nr:hypothetical protein [Streptomyces sp. NBC_01483]
MAQVRSAGGITWRTATRRTFTDAVHQDLHTVSVGLALVEARILLRA